MAYVVQFYGTPVFNAWLGRPNMAYGISVDGYVVSPIYSPIQGSSSHGSKVAIAKFPVDVVAAYFYAYVGGLFTEPIYVGLDFPSRTVFLALIGVKP